MNSLFKPGQKKEKEKENIVKRKKEKSGSTLCTLVLRPVRYCETDTPSKYLYSIFLPRRFIDPN